MLTRIRFTSALLCGLTLCLTTFAYAQTVSYGEPRSENARSEDVADNLGAIELKLEAVLALLPTTIGGKDLETARTQIKAAFKTIAHAVKDIENDIRISGGLVRSPSVSSQVGRYQISAWTMPSPSGIGESSIGAFIIDTQSGMVWKLENDSIQPIAKVPE